MRSSEIAGALSGITYRQLDYWTTQGYIRADSTRPGSGIARDWTDHELHVAAVIARLRVIGLPLPEAARMARANVEQGRTVFDMGGGLSLHIGEDEDA